MRKIIAWISALLNNRKKGYFDFTLVFCVLVLIVIGCIMIYSTSAYEAGIHNDDSAFYLKKQLLAVGIGLVGMLIVALIPYEMYNNRIAVVVTNAVAILFLFLLWTPLAYSANGATRWVRLVGNLTIQPAEIVKIAVIIYLAQYLNVRTKIIAKFGAVVNAAALPVVYFLWIWVGTSNLSSAIIVAGITAGMIFIVAPDYKKYAIVVGAVLAIAIVVILIVKNLDVLGWDLGYRGDRVKAWLNPAEYASDEGYQTLQSLYAIGSGGFFGKGMGSSVQKLGSLPEAQNDMIFAIICEELGAFGGILIMVVFLVLIYRCYYIAKNASDLFGTLLASGVMIHLALQVILNIAVVTNTIPNTGISLPFISYGGTSVLFLLVEMGVVLSVGKSIRVEQ